jgi:hypothetical protein
MRDIKFRFWDEPNNKMRSWDEWSRQASARVLLDSNYPPARIIPMQFTGLVDKNGVEIYEGDIIFCDRCNLNSEISWGKKSAMFYFHRPNVHDAYDVDCQCIEVIGNIHQNPELIK